MSYSKYIHSIDKSVEKIEHILLVISKLALFLMMVSLTTTTMGRYLFSRPIPGTHSFVTNFLMIAVVFLSVSWVQRVGGNVKVEVFSRMMPEQIVHILVIMTNIGLLSFLILIEQGLIETAFDRYTTMATSLGSINIPSYVAWTTASVGVGILIIRILVEILRDVESLFGGG